MDFNNRLFRVIGVDPLDTKNARKVVKKAGMDWEDFKYYNENNILPTGNDLDLLEKVSGKSHLEMKLILGIIDQELKEIISKNSKEIIESIGEEKKIMNL
jgi:site-specific DNA-methyltransferase (adenine-specific)